jgi:phage repressor protein C with HTH and peptisase S24 domain
MRKKFGLGLGGEEQQRHVGRVDAGEGLWMIDGRLPSKACFACHPHAKTAIPQMVDISQHKVFTKEDAEFRSRLAQVLARFGSVAALARAIGVSNNAIYKWLQGDGQPNLSNLVGLSRAARVSIEWLATGRGATARRDSAEPRPLGEGYTFMPRFDARGKPKLMNDQIVDSLALSSEWVRTRLHTEPRNLLLIEIAGDSMAPTLNQTDLAIVDLGEPRFRRDAIYVLRHSEELAVRRLQRRPDGKLIIKCDNPAYEPVVAAPETIAIIGCVIWSGTRR